MDGFDNEVYRHDIPGLAETEKNKKGKKKNNKKTLSLQSFLQDEMQEPQDSAENSETDVMESHFAKLNLDEEELIVMESCHSYIHDLLRQMGPTNAMDPRLQSEINNFPPEAKRVIQKCGGYRNFILRSKDLAVVDKIVATKSDLRNAQEMAFTEIYNNLPHFSSTVKNENINSEVSKDIWNSKPNILNLNKSSGNIWSHQDIGKPSFQDKLHLEMPKTSNLISNHNQESDLGVIGNVANIESDVEFSARQNLLKGLNMTEFFQTSNNLERTSFQNQLEEYKERNRKLTEVNNDLIKKLAEKEKIIDEFAVLQSKYLALEALQHNTKNDFEFCKNELEITKAELKRARAENPTNLESKLDCDRQIIFSLQNNLKSEQLRNLNLKRELEMQRNLTGSSCASLTMKEDTKPPGFFTNQPSSHGRGWENSMSPTPLNAQLNMDNDLLGLRSMFSGDAAVGSSVGLTPSTPSSGIQAKSEGYVNSIAPNQMFGGLIGPGPESKPRPMSKSASTSSLGFHTLPMPESMQFRKPSPVVEHPPPTSFPNMFSHPPPPAPSLTSSSNKTARQEQLVKKLVAMLPGSDEETIKNCISALRVRHGKLSGWPTSKIASHIAEIIKHDGGIRE